MIALRIKVGDNHVIVRTPAVRVEAAFALRPVFACSTANTLLTHLASGDIARVVCELEADATLSIPATCVKDAWEE